MTRTVLQRIDLDPPLEVIDLYLRELGRTTTGEPIEATSEGLLVPAGTVVTFDTYFSAFFENHWFGYTHLKSVFFEVEVEGRAIVTLRRQTPEGDHYLLKREEINGRAQIEFQVDNDNELRVEAGRLWFEIETLDDSVVRSACWTTDDTPQRPVALGVVFCTFNRQQYLGRILRALDEDSRAMDAITRVFVVNQGDSFTAEEILGRDHAGRLLPKLTIIEQQNMGGCGGFTRGMYETVAADDLTHFLLMDDDSRVYAESVARAAHFMAYCDAEVVLGGHMLNLHRPRRLFEAGAMFDPSSLQPNPIHHNIDLGHPVDLEAFLRAGAVDYNGWWMFGAPASVIENIGYPMPCFIRGDDMEFGLRIKNSGLQTVTVPGVGVWHEPFYLKLGGWQFYFEVRNRLAMAALHSHGDFQGIRKDFRRVFSRDIGMCRYHSCKLMIEAMRAYLDGPDIALDTSDGPLRAAVAIVAEYGPEQVAEIGHTPSRAEDRHHRGELRQMLDTVRESAERRVGKVALVAQLARRMVVPEQASDKPEKIVRSNDLRPHVVAGYDRYIVIEEHGGQAWRFRRDGALEKSLWREFLELSKRVDFDPRYLEEFEATDRFADSWREIFNLTDVSHD